MGFTMLHYTDYIEAVQKLRPDIVIGIGDVVFGNKPGLKRLDKMPDRTLSWMHDLIEAIEDDERGPLRSTLFAPILPIERDIQRFYLEALEDTFRDKISGLVLYGPGSYETIPSTLEGLPRLDGSSSTTPHRLLDLVEAGADIMTVPFGNEASDAGIALDFVLSSASEQKQEGTSGSGKIRPLGIDLWSPEYAVDLAPLTDGCTCYACANHHRAFVQHLLNAKEMLGWVLLQIHNYHVLDVFFMAVRQSLSDGTFDERKEKFQHDYDHEIPSHVGRGPRIRGYQVKSEKKESKRNPVAWNRSMNDGAGKNAEAEIPEPDVGTEELINKGFAEKAVDIV